MLHHTFTALLLLAGCSSGSATQTGDDGASDSGAPDTGFPATGTLPRVSISVDDDIDPGDEPWVRDWQPASIEITRDGQVLHGGRAGIHVRGNSSTQYDKKSFALETWDANDADADASLLGMPAEEDWVLQGPYSDKTLMRNHLAYSLFRAIGRYAARTAFVELELNGDYRGIYVLMEKVKRGPDRVDLPDGGALLKRDWVEEEDDDPLLETARCRDFLTVEWPDSVGTIDTRLDAAEAALLDGDHGPVDLDSFVDHMLLVELARNVDAYVLSTFITLSPGGTLGMGPVWDFNGALGNADYFEAWETAGWHYDNPEFPADNRAGFCWYEALLASPDFQTLRAERWRAHRAGPWSDASLQAEIASARQVLAPAVDANFARWPVLGEYVWPNDEGAEDRDSHVEEVAYLEQWLLARAAWMDGEL